MAALFYGALVGAALLWNGLRDRELLLFAGSVPTSILVGCLSAVVTVSAGVLLHRALPVVRELSDELAPLVLDGSSRASLISVSVFSGVGEEVFFRGAVQPEFGLLVAAVLFGILHVGPDRWYLLWTIWAVLVGILFGLLYNATGGLLAPILAHTLHNAATFLLWRRSRRAVVPA